MAKIESLDASTTQATQPPFGVALIRCGFIRRPVVYLRRIRPHQDLQELLRALEADHSRYQGQRAIKIQLTNPITIGPNRLVGSIVDSRFMSKELHYHTSVQSPQA